MGRDTECWGVWRDVKWTVGGGRGLSAGTRRASEVAPTGSWGGRPQRIPGDPSGHCIRTARLGAVQIQVHGWGRVSANCPRCGAGVRGRQSGGRKRWLRTLHPSRTKQATYWTLLPPSSPEDTNFMQKLRCERKLDRPQLRVPCPLPS